MFEQNMLNGGVNELHIQQISFEIPSIIIKSHIVEPRRQNEAERSRWNQAFNNTLLMLCGFYWKHSLRVVWHCTRNCPITAKNAYGSDRPLHLSPDRLARPRSRPRAGMHRRHDERQL